MLGELLDTIHLNENNLDDVELVWKVLNEQYPIEIQEYFITPADIVKALMPYNLEEDDTYWEENF